MSESTAKVVFDDAGRFARMVLLFVHPWFTYAATHDGIISSMPLGIAVAEGVPVYNMFRLYHLA